MPFGMGYGLRRFPHRPPRLRCNSLHSMQPPHLRDRVRVVCDFDLCCSLVRSVPPSYAISVRRLGTLPAASFRFRLAADTLAVRLTLPTTKRVVDFHHQAIAHGGRTTTRKGAPVSLPFFVLPSPGRQVPARQIEKRRSRSSSGSLRRACFSVSITAPGTASRRSAPAPGRESS